MGFTRKDKSVVYKDSRQLNLDRLKSYFESENSSSDEDDAEEEELNCSINNHTAEKVVAKQSQVAVIKEDGTKSTEPSGGEIEMKNVLSNQTMETKALSKNKEAPVELGDKVNPNVIGATSDDSGPKMGGNRRKIPTSGAQEGHLLLLKTSFLQYRVLFVKNWSEQF